VRAILAKHLDLSKGTVRCWFDSMLYTEAGITPMLHDSRTLNSIDVIAARLGCVSSDVVASIRFLRKRKANAPKVTTIVKRLQKATASILQSQWIQHCELSHNNV
jgi:hypothetical protein